ncbi:nitroreductase [Scatolibacter rhodanostii]|uniref:nitroreductase n=1 Tax=Scatolibacter rhodanostii TaxID=2014781 RepID=UPI000C068783|nr:nitroreductase [Scatolibacter rhodanostii]
MNETLKAIENRYSCRDFKPEMLSEEVLQAIAKAAVQAPSAMNRQPWRIVVVKDQELMQEIEQEGLKTLSDMEDKSAYNRIMERGGKLFYGAPSMIVVPIDSAEYASAMLDCGIVCQNIVLAAESLGVGSVICGLLRTAFAKEERAKEWAARLKFPEGYVLGCSVLLGYANTSKQPHEPDIEKIVVLE